eukprot:1156271-Pelagomonas_calceolata.AAC.4
MARQLQLRQGSCFKAFAARQLQEGICSKAFTASHLRQGIYLKAFAARHLATYAIVCRNLHKRVVHNHVTAGASGQLPKASLQQLIEEGEDGEVEEEVVNIDGEPSSLSIPGEQQQQQQHRSKTSTSEASLHHRKPQRQASELADDGFVVEEEGEGLDYVGELPPLVLEDSQELKRRIFPADVVKVGLNFLKRCGGLVVRVELEDRQELN